MSLLNSETLSPDLRQLRLILTPVDSGSTTKDYYLVTDVSGEQVAEVVQDTISEDGLVIVTLFNGQVERALIGKQELEDWLEVSLSRMLEQSVTVDGL